MLWIGGDGHCAGAYAVNNYSTCEDDPDLWWRGRQPHPENAAINWATTLAKTLKLQFINDADEMDNAQSILVKGQRWINTNKRSKNIVLVGFPDPQADALKEYSQFLKEHETRHIFFNTNDYINFLKSSGFCPNQRGYFGRDAHQAWANVMLSQLRGLEII